MRITLVIKYNRPPIPIGSRPFPEPHVVGVSTPPPFRPVPPFAMDSSTPLRSSAALAPPIAAIRPRRPLVAGLRRAWFQVHWFIGITAGSVLVVIGLTGATLDFREELQDAIDPGVRHVAVRDARPLAPAAIVEAVARAHGDARVANFTMSAEPGTAVRVSLAPAAGSRRGETLYVDPYAGTIQPPLRATPFFEWVEELHRWLLLPHEAGRLVAGTLAACLLTMALSGLYLRWPRRPLEWRHWLTFDTSMKGRLFLRGLHSVLGTCVLAIYLVTTSTGLYWAFETVKGAVDGWVGASRVERPAGAAGNARRGGEGGERRRGADGEAPANAPVDLDATWTAFVTRAGAWQQATLRLPERASQPVQIMWLAADAPHERARNRMTIRPQTGEVAQDERYASQPAGDRFVSLAYPLHTGTYFGLAGRIVMLCGALSLPVFAVTGWMMYLSRRRHRAHRRDADDGRGRVRR
jgi:sulfite reductase (NADPH) flavoprotein alpha-component